jgi:penicillin-binding protein 2
VGKAWQHGDTFNLGIGQGYMLSTPLQLAIMTARLANGGYEVQPNLLLAKATSREELVPPAPRDKPTAPSLRINPQFLAMVRSGMDQVVNSSQGTANQLRIDSSGKLLEPALRFAGKTGTAQVKRITERERAMGITQEQLPWHLRHHALFVCFGPVDNPRYAVSVIVEHGMGGGMTAGPIGRDVLVETMKRDPSRRTDGFRKMASR